MARFSGDTNLHSVFAVSSLYSKLSDSISLKMESRNRNGFFRLLRPPRHFIKDKLAYASHSHLTPRPRQLPKIPSGIGQEQSPNARCDQIFVSALEQIGCDSSDEDKQERHRDELEAQSRIMRRTYGKQQ